MSKSSAKKLSDKLKFALKEYTERTVVPFLQDKITHDHNNTNVHIHISDDGEKMEVHYPSLFGSQARYMQNFVLVEFGARNTAEPSEPHTIQPIIKQLYPTLELPIAEVSVLSPIRTFWEKATLMHVECNRGRLSNSPERLSRHWYDLVMLANSWVGASIKENYDLLANVVNHKKVMYAANYANYDDCLIGKLRLVPDEAGIKGLSLDYGKMIDSGMFENEPPAITELISSLKNLEILINSHNF